MECGTKRKGGTHGQRDPASGHRKVETLPVRDGKDQPLLQVDTRHHCGAGLWGHSRPFVHRPSRQPSPFEALDGRGCFYFYPVIFLAGDGGIGQE